MATITKTVGSNSRDYTTIALALASIPTNVVTSGNRYIIAVYNDTPADYTFASTPAVTITGFTTDATHDITIKCGTGQSFYDHTNKRTNRLAVNSSNGVMIKTTSAYGQVVSIGSSNVFLDGLQLQATGANSFGVYSSSGTAPVITQCIIESKPTSSLDCVAFVVGGGKIVNSLLIHNSSSTSVSALRLTSGASAYNCTIVRPSNYTAGGTAITADYGTASIKNCAIFGFTTTKAGSSTINADGHNATDAATAPGSTSNLTSQTYSSVFEQSSNGSSVEDFRLKSGSPLINVGVTDTTNIPGSNDISGFSRSSWDIGAWEFGSSTTDYPLTAAAGTFALTGVATGVKAGRKVAAAAGAVALTGVAASVAKETITIAARTLPTTADWNKVAYNGTVFCAVSYGSASAATSTDGITWTARTMPASANFIDLTTNGSIFVALITYSATCYTSSDGITWTSRTMPSSSPWTSVAWNGSVFCAVATDGSTAAATSPDGITWTARTLPSADYWGRITAKGSRFCAVSMSAPGGAFGDATKAIYSDDGITWNTGTLPGARTWSAIAANNEVFVALSDFDDMAATSPDGATWTARTLPASVAWRTFGWNGSRFLAVGKNVTNCATSTDGITWLARTMPSAAAWNGIASKDNRFVVVAGNASTTAATADVGSNNNILDAALGTFTLTGIAAAMRLARKVTASTGTYSVTGNAATSLPTGVVTSQPAPDGQNQQFIGTTTDATSGTYTLTGSNGGVTVGPSPFTVTANAFDFTVEGLAAGDYAPTLTVTGPAGVRGVTGTSSFTILGAGGGGGFDSTISPEVGTYAVTGNTAAFQVARRMTAAAASYTLTGIAATMRTGKTLTATTVAFTFSGVAAGVNSSRRMPVSVGSFSLTGNDIDASGGRAVVADRGIFVLTQGSAGVNVTRPMACTAGSFSMTGNAVTLRKGALMSASAASYAVTGVAAIVYKAYTLTAATDSVVLTGAAAAIGRTKYLLADVATFTQTGVAVSFALQPLPATPTGVATTVQVGTVGVRAWGIISTRQHVETWTDIDN